MLFGRPKRGKGIEEIVVAVCRFWQRGGTIGLAVSRNYVGFARPAAVFLLCDMGWKSFQVQKLSSGYYLATGAGCLLLRHRLHIGFKPYQFPGSREQLRFAFLHFHWRFRNGCGAGFFEFQ